MTTILLLDSFLFLKLQRGPFYWENNISRSEVGIKYNCVSFYRSGVLPLPLENWTKLGTIKPKDVAWFLMCVMLAQSIPISYHTVGLVKTEVTSTVFFSVCKPAFRTCWPGDLGIDSPLENFFDRSQHLSTPEIGVSMASTPYTPPP